MKRYFNRRYYAIDPVHRAAATAASGFFWDTLEVSDPSTLAFYHDAKAHGIGPSGYTLPIITERGDKIAISASASEDRELPRPRPHVQEGCGGARSRPRGAGRLGGEPTRFAE